MNGRCISQIELAQRWQISESTLERWRSEGIGPVFLKLRGQVRYRDTDILAYEDQALHASARYRAGAVPSDIYYASPFKEKFMQANHTPAESTTMFNETELASRWKISVRTLQDWRRRKTGPRFVKLQGWAVRYPLQAVIEFEEQSVRLVN